MKKLLNKITLSLITVTMLAACGGNSNKTNSDGADQVNIKIAVVGNEEHQSTILANIFKKNIESSSTDFKVDIYPNAALGGEREAAESVKMGTTQMTMVTSDGALPAWVPEVQILSIPYLFKNSEQAYKALDGIITEELNPKFEAAGFKHLGYGELGFRHFTNSKREVKSAKDMEGLSIRVQEAPIWFALMKSLKASAVPVSFNELYTALQQGMVDGQENPIATVATQKFVEVQKYMSLDGHTYGAVSMVMNKDFFDSLSAEQRELIEKASNNAVSEQRKVVSKKESEYLEEVKKNGMIVTENVDKDSFVQATKGVYQTPEVKALVAPKFVDEVREFIK